MKQPDLQIEYRNIKNINLYIQPPDGAVLVTAPHGVTKRRIMKFVAEKQAWIEKAQERVRKKQQFYQTHTITAEQLQQLKQNIELLARKWQPVMGVTAAGFTIRDMKTRWGSCTVATGKIRINKRLAVYPPEILEYIVVHELCHLLEPSHDQRFHAYMTQFLPDWKERRKQLNDPGK